MSVVTYKTGGWCVMETKFLFEERQLTGSQEDLLCELIEIFSNFSSKIRKCKFIDICADYDPSNYTGQFQSKIIVEPIIIFRNGNNDAEYYYYFSKDNYVMLEIKNGEVVYLKIIQHGEKIVKNVYDIIIRVEIKKDEDNSGNSEKTYYIKGIDEDESWYKDFIMEARSL